MGVHFLELSENLFWNICAWFPSCPSQWRNTSLGSEINRIWVCKVKKREFSGLQREAQVVGIKMPVSEREGGEVLVCKAKVVNSVWDLLKGHIGSSCEVGKYKGLNHWRVWCWKRVGRTQGGAPGHPALRTVTERVTSTPLCGFVPWAWLIPLTFSEEA